MDKGAGLDTRGTPSVCASPAPSQSRREQASGLGMGAGAGRGARALNPAAVSRVSRRARAGSNCTLKQRVLPPWLNVAWGADADADAHARWPVWM